VGDVFRTFGPHCVSRRYILSSPWYCYFEQFLHFAAFWTYSVFSYPSRLGGIPWLHQFNIFKGFSIVSYVRHIIELIFYSGSFPGHIFARGMCTWLVRWTLVSWLQAGGCEVDELPGPGTVLWYDVSPFDELPVELGPSYHLIPVHLLHSAIMAGYYSMRLFPVSASSISFHRCYCTCILSCGCVGLLVRRYWCEFLVCCHWQLVIEF